jgi:serine/threonine protein kinase
MNTFTTTQGKNTLQCTLEEMNGQPIKLGDGTFGVVLKVKLPTGGPGAVKLFYKNDTASIQQRIEFETSLGESIIRRQEMGKEPPGDLSTLVLPYSVCRDFIQSDAFRSCEGYFRASGVELSGVGVVMHYFECTLKDLLERGAPVGRASGNAFLAQPGVAGYSILRDLDSDDRERCILPILRQIAIGLRSLHTLKLHHHDLKPANVLIKSEAGNIRVALGDFGFADPNMCTDTMHVSLQDEALALGTRHYRSVEQKDYLDVCEADVDVVESPNDTMSVIVETRDAKFFDSIIEKGDICIFRKDSEKRAWIIDRVDRRLRDPNFVTKITLSPVRTKDQGGNATRITPDKRTQVAFLKRQTHRTDLFGFGALAFDLLTAGKSPERFYDLLRPLDRLQEDGRPIQVMDVKRAYLAFSNAPSAEPAHRALFNELRLGSSFPSPAFVAMLLKCMLSKPEDSFFGGDSGRSSAECFGMLANEIESLVSETNALRFLPDNANPLWTGERRGPEGGPRLNLGFTATLEEHRKAFTKQKKALTLVKAYRLLRQIAKTVNDLIIRHTDKKLFFAHLGPDHLEEDGTYDEQTVAYLNEETFLSALRSGEVVGFGSTAERTNFVPPFMRYRTRSLFCMAVPTGGAGGEQGLRYRAFYRDSVPCWPGIHTGDFVRLWVPNEAVELFQVMHAKNDIIDVKLLKETKNGKEREYSSLTGELVKRVEAIDYYLGVLGIYVHQLFFVDEFTDFAPIPARVWWLEEAACLKRLDRNALNDKCDREKVTRGASSDVVLREAAKLYIWLLMRLYKGSGATPEPATAQLRAQVSERIGRLGDAIAKAMGEELKWLNAVADESPEKLQQEIGNRGAGLETNAASLNDLIEEIASTNCLTDKSSTSFLKFVKKQADTAVGALRRRGEVCS